MAEMSSQNIFLAAVRMLGTVLLFVFVVHFFLEQLPLSEKPDQKLHRLLSMQRQLDHYLPLSKINLQGTHNSYNSDAYHTLLRYHDRQQHLSIGEQLDFGARFIELDVHYTFSAHKMEKDFLLCHGSSKFNSLPFHWGCSLFDLPLQEALLEIKAWLDDPVNQREFLIFYIEDHSEGEHERLYSLLEQNGIVENIFPSGECRKIPSSITKEEVLSSGKRIVFWKDKLRLGFEEIPCSEFPELRDLAFNKLGSLDREAEDRTSLGALAKRLERGDWPRIEAVDIRPLMAAGANIINFDNFSVNDERLYELLWSWESNIDFETLGSESCAVFTEGGRWLLDDCNQNERRSACFDESSQAWFMSEQKVSFQNAAFACQNGSVFSAPANFLENQQLAQAIEFHKDKTINTLWLNVRYFSGSNSIELGHKRKHNSE